MPNTDYTLSDQERIVHECIVAIASHCDGALEKDNVGFNGQDTKFGRRVAGTPFEEWTPEIITECAHILGATYSKQAKVWTGHDVTTLSIVRDAVANQTNHAARAQARAAEAKRNAASKRTITVERYGAGELVFTFPFDREILTALKASSASFHFSSRDKTWRISPAAVNKDVINVAATYGFRYDADVDKLLEAGATITQAEVHTGKVVLEDAHLLITLVGRLGQDRFRQYRNLTGYRWVRGGDDSTADVTEGNLSWLASNGFSGTEGIWEQFSTEHAAFAARQAEQRLAAAERLATSRAAESDLDLSHVTPEGLTPYGFQVAGVEYALKARRTFIADEMGLGKTVQAILAVQASRPNHLSQTIVVCPASLKGNWAKEIARWAPGTSIVTLSGRTPSADFNAAHADWIIVNYDIVAGWGEYLATLSPYALILDESHYAKNPAAKRTKALLKLSEAVPVDGLVLLLTGTPILNRPVELVTQLRLLGKLNDVAPAPTKGRTDAKSVEFAFKFRYCGAEKNAYGWVFNSSSNETELNEKLRASCLIRRERANVLDLKDTVRTQVSLTLNGALKDYRAAEKDAIAFIRNELGSEAARKALRAETLVRINLLRRLAEEAKVAATIEWVEDWLESYPTKKLVIFSSHVSVQHALRDHFNCPTILGSQKDTEGQKALFQDGDARVIVCSLQAAREGHTLTAASDVVFTSLGWTPGGLQQAEDRCNRIGQEADKVVAWQLHAEDTIEETIGALIAAKRQVFNAVVRGDGTEIDESVLDGVIDYLQNREA